MSKPKKPDGGPAYPVTSEDIARTCGLSYEQSAGMSIRDWFAGQALAGMCAGLTGFSDDPTAKAAGIITNRPRDLSEIAYTYADAMLAARERKE